MFFIYDFSIHFKIIKKHPPPANQQVGGALPVFRAVVVEPRGIEFGNESNSSAGKNPPYRIAMRYQRT